MSRCVDYAAWKEHVRRLQKSEIARTNDLEVIMDKDNPYASGPMPYFARGLPSSFLNDSSKTRMLLAPATDPGRWHAWQSTARQAGVRPKAPAAPKEHAERLLPEATAMRRPSTTGVDMTTPRLPSCASSLRTDTSFLPATPRRRVQASVDTQFFCPPL
mmetsp:Transcript_6948/g.16362  ORF Transcript_6948/g.16362 Transcript_6948/m.16362 type:complete len:159 (+) Transcript_6948:87-563(+)|eukprot:s2274_g1.t1